MSILTLSTIMPIGIGVVIVFVSILRSKSLFMAMPFIVGKNRPAVTRFLRHHKMLLVLFLVGHVVVGGAISLGLPFGNTPVIGASFFLVAVFIYFSSVLETKLLTEIQDTVQALMPICASCKKMRSPDADWRKPESWMEIERFITSETGANFTHGLCPECSKEFLTEHEDYVKSGKVSE